MHSPHTLEELLRLARERSWHLVEIVTQDEYTHDVVIAEGARFLVYDTT
jgi:hypothetical protein